MLCGDGIGAYKVFYVGGSDSGNSPYGGWQNFAVDPTMAYDEVFGSPTAYYIVGAGANVLSAVSKGNPLGFDVFRYGRGILYIDNGQSGSYATFAGVAAANDASAARWGLFQAIAGGYKQKGILSFGENAYCEFTDQNKSIVIDDSIYVDSDFNRIEIYNASSKVYWTNISVRSLCSVSPGRLEMMAAADVQFDGCTFINMDTFIFLSSASITNCIFQGCNQITTGGADMSYSKFSGYEGTSGSSGILYNSSTDPNTKMVGLTITKGTAATHAIQFADTIPSEITLTDIAFSGYNASNDQDDSTLYFADTAGTITVNLVGCTGNISYKSAGATIIPVIDPVTTSIEVRDITSLTVIEGARVLVLPSDGTGDLNYQASVTQITRSGSTATVSQTAHGLATDDKVYIQGANEPEYNGIHQITYISDNSYSFTVSGTPDSPATGTIVETDVLISATTNTSGLVTDTRSFSKNQPITGRVREGTNPEPNYKTSPITGSVDKDKGLSAIIFLVRD
jgi:hypothetical protein